MPNYTRNRKGPLKQGKVEKFFKKKQKELKNKATGVNLSKIDHMTLVNAPGYVDRWDQMPGGDFKSVVLKTSAGQEHRSSKYALKMLVSEGGTIKQASASRISNNTSEPIKIRGSDARGQVLFKRSPLDPADVQPAQGQTQISAGNKKYDISQKSSYRNLKNSNKRLRAVEKSLRAVGASNALIVNSAEIVLNPGDSLSIISEPFISNGKVVYHAVKDSDIISGDMANILSASPELKTIDFSPKKWPMTAVWGEMMDVLGLPSPFVFDDNDELGLGDVVVQDLMAGIKEIILTTSDAGKTWRSGGPGAVDDRPSPNSSGDMTWSGKGSGVEGEQIWFTIPQTLTTGYRLQSLEYQHKTLYPDNLHVNVWATFQSRHYQESLWSNKWTSEQLVNNAGVHSNWNMLPADRSEMTTMNRERYAYRIRLQYSGDAWGVQNWANNFLSLRLVFKKD